MNATHESTTPNKRISVLGKLSRLLLVSFAVVVAIAYVSYLLGSRYFLLPEDINRYNPIINIIVRAALFIGNMFFMFSISLGVYDKRIIKILMPYVLIYIVCELTCPNWVNGFITPSIYCLITSFWMHNTKYFLKEHILFMAIIYVYQLLTVQIKLNVIGFGYVRVDFVRNILMSVDLYLLYAVYYILKGVKQHVGKIIVRLDNELANLREEKHSSENRDAEDLEFIKAFSVLSLWNKARTTINLICMQLGQLFAVILVCAAGNAVYGKYNDPLGETAIELAIIFTMFWAARSVLRKCWHSNSAIVCTLAGTGVFFIATRITLPVSIAPFMPVLIGVLIGIGMAMAVKPKKFNCKTATEQELREQCRACRLDEESTELCVEMFIVGTPVKELAIRTGYERQTISTKKYRWKKLLEDQKTQ